MSSREDIILKIENLTKEYSGSKGTGLLLQHDIKSFKAVAEANLELKKGKTLGLVGESGSGKSTIARCLMGITKPNEGRILYKGKDVSQYDSKELKALKRQIQMIFQDPYSSFEPKKNFDFSLKEPMLALNIASKKTANIKVNEILEKVGLDIGLKQRYPKQLSGGQCQRMNIARALLLMPEVLVCDEPVSALDISIQAQILNLLKAIQNEYGLAYLFISHDLSVIKYMSDDVAIIYKGRIVENGSSSILSSPKHPYTQLLLESMPPKSPYERSIKDNIEYSTEDTIKGCAFYNRCSKKIDLCKNKQPISKQISEGHFVECFLFS